MLKKFLERLNISTFSTNILKVLSGNAVGQVINIITIPIIARIFTKEVLGLNELLISVISTLFITSSFRYEAAIVLADDNEESEQLFFLSHLLLLIFTLVLFLVLLFFAEPFLKLFNAEKIEGVYYIIVIGVFFTRLSANRSARFNSE